MIHRRLLRLAGPVLGWILLSVAAMLITAGLSVGLGLSIAHLLTAAITDRDITTPAVTTVGLLIARALAFWLRESIITWVGIRIRRRLRGVLIAHLDRLGPGALAQQRSGGLAATIVDGVESLDPYYARYLPSLVVTVVMPLSVVTYLWTISAASATVLLVACLLAIVPARFLDATLMNRGRERWQEQQTLSADFLDAVQAIPTLRIFGTTGTVGGSLSGRAWRLYRMTVGQLRISLVELGLTGFAVYGGSAAATVIAAIGAWRGTLTIGEAFVVLLLSREVFRPVTELGAAWHAGYLGLTAADSIDEFLQTPPRVVFDGHDDSPARRPSPIVFHGVDYRYPAATNDHWALRDIDLEIPAGATVAIVGASGSGKTTAVRLLARSDDPAQGQILLDGRPLPGFTREALTDSMAVVSQHSMVFAGTIAHNIALGSPQATPDEICQAARFAEAHSFIEALPDGYDTVLGEFGSGLSGGQRQRLAIARAILQDRPLLVLDEATAHLDVRTEAAITSRLAARHDRTTIVITHRLDSVRGADHIVVLDHGRIATQGSYEQVRATRSYQAVEASL